MKVKYNFMYIFYKCWEKQKKYCFYSASHRPKPRHHSRLWRDLMLITSYLQQE
jgi:hypothetical protein